MSKKQALFDTISSLKSDYNSYDVNEVKFIHIRDDNNNNYQSPFIRYDSSNALDKSTSYTDFAGSYLFIPHQIVLAAGPDSQFTETYVTVAPGAAPAVSNNNNLAACIKTSAMNLIHQVLIQLGSSSLQVSDNGQYHNLFANYQLMHLSDDQVKSIGQYIQYFPDKPESQEILGADSKNGPKSFLVNNQTIKTPVSTTTNITLAGAAINGAAAGAAAVPISIPKADTGSATFYSNELFNGVNDGLLERLKMIGYNGSSISSFVDNNVLKTMRRSHVENAYDSIKYNIYTLIPLALLHPVFKNLPICRGLQLRMTLNLNTNYKSTITCAADGTAVESATYSSGNSSNMCPYMLSDRFQIKPKTGGAKPTFTIENVIGGDTVNKSTWLVMKQIKYSPEMEKRLISQNEKITVQYEDFFSVVGNADFKKKAYNDTVNNIKVGECVRPRKLIVIPQLSAQSITIGAAAVNIIEPYKTPFSSAPFTTSPYALLKDFNVYKNGEPIYSTGHQYTYESYVEAINDVSLDGHQLKQLGVGSGSNIINIENWHNGQTLYVVDLTHGTKHSADDNLKTEISVSFQNQCKLAQDYWMLVVRQKELKVNINTGEIEMVVN